MPDASDLLVTQPPEVPADKLVTPKPPPTVLTSDTIAGLQITKPDKGAFINMLIYGEPGVGKTRLAGSASLVEAMSPVGIIDFEGGTLSLAHSYPNVDVIRSKSWTDVDRLYGALYDKNPYKTIILDSLTEIQKFAMGEIMKAVVKKDESRDPDVASLREWGKSGEQIRRFVRGFRDLPCNTIFTALDMEDRDERSGLTKVKPSLPGKLKGEVAGFVDIVIYMYKKEVRDGQDKHMKVLALTEGTEKAVAKDRSGKLPTVMEAPTMQDIYNWMQGQGDKTQ